MDMGIMMENHVNVTLIESARFRSNNVACTLLRRMETYFNYNP